MRHLLLICLFFSFPAFGLQAAEPAPFEIREVIAEVSGELPVAEELGKVVVDQTALESAVAEVDQYGVPRVLITFNAEGKEAFAGATRERVGERLAILIDGEVVVAPVIRTSIVDGKVVITGNYSEEETEALAAQLQAAITPVE